jgi:hypothetical protein
MNAQLLARLIAIAIVVTTVQLPIADTSRVHAQSASVLGSACDDVAPTSQEVVEAAIKAAAVDPPSLVGAFHDGSGGNGHLGATYEVETSDRGLWRLELDGITWAATNGYLGTDIGEAASSFHDVAGIIRTLSIWSSCVKELDELRLAALFTPHGLSWIYAPADPFLHEKSPASWLYSLSPAGSLGALPLVALNVQTLTDGRIAALIMEGSAALDGILYEPASVWVFTEIGSSWLIDGIVGGGIVAFPPGTDPANLNALVID